MTSRLNTHNPPSGPLKTLKSQAHGVERPVSRCTSYWTQEDEKVPSEPCLMPIYRFARGMLGLRTPNQIPSSRAPQ